MKDNKHIQSFGEFNENLNISDVIDSKINRSREEVIELLSNSSNFEIVELKKMTNDELVELWNSLEMDNWLDELENED
jgi:hypothetical protein